MMISCYKKLLWLKYVYVYLFFKSSNDIILNDDYYHDHNSKVYKWVRNDWNWHIILGEKKEQG